MKTVKGDYECLHDLGEEKKNDEKEAREVMKRTTAQDYLAEEIVVGGEKTTRGQFILGMKAQGATQRQIDLYMMGLEQTKRRKEAVKNGKEKRSRHDVGSGQDGCSN